MKIKITKNIFSSGYRHPDYDVRVMNEREVRAASGILFLLSSLGFSLAWFTGNFLFLQYFVTFFVLDFIIRVFVSPHFSPSLVFGRIIVSKQIPEYTGAKQKRFAWGLGLLIAMILFIRLVILSSFGPLNLILCITCLTLLFFETSFGICIGCKIYNFITKENPQLCPGGVCEKHEKEDIQKVSLAQISTSLSIIIVVTLLIVSGVYSRKDESIESNVQTEEILEECKVPQWAIDIGHEELWKLHNGCE